MPTTLSNDRIVTWVTQPDTCMYDVYPIPIHVPMRHICMMHLSMMLDPDTCMYDAFFNFPRSVTLMHVCMMHISMVMDLGMHVCMVHESMMRYFSVTDQRTRRF